MWWPLVKELPNLYASHRHTHTTCVVCVCVCVCVCLHLYDVCGCVCACACVCLCMHVCVCLMCVCLAFRVMLNGMIKVATLSFVGKGRNGHKYDFKPGEQKPPERPSCYWTCSFSGCFFSKTSCPGFALVYYYEVFWNTSSLISMAAQVRAKRIMAYTYIMSRWRRRGVRRVY